MTDTNELLRKIKEGSEAETWAAIQELIHLRPTTAEESKARACACACMAEASFARGKHGTAIDWWQEALAGDPLNVDYRMGIVAKGLLPCSMLRQALNEAERITNLDSENPMAWRLVGHVNMLLGDKDAAKSAFEKLIELRPDDPASYLDRNDLALDSADWEFAEKTCNKLLKMHGPHIGNALHQFGLLKFRTGEHEEALRLWDETLEHKCDNPEAVIWNQSIAMMALGKYREGWRKHEARGVQKRDNSMSVQMHRGAGKFLWCNEPPPARLHVYQEMGFGDAIAMARYLPLLVEKGYDVQFEVMNSLVDLMRDSLPGVKVIPRSPIYPDLPPDIEFDYVVPALSLPRLFGTEVKTIPWNGPYLKADPKKVAEYRKRLDGANAVGFCWSAGVRTQHGMWLEEYGKRKSIPFDKLGPIIGGAKGRCLRLQVGAPRKDADGWLNDYLPDNPTWADTAALIECLDLVITVDTGLAHLAGAMGKPVWVLMHTEGSWHWMAERPGASWNETSPWYPSARLFRQKKPHEWDDVIDRVASEITGYFQKAA